jgi:hypothetical protein
MFNEGCGNERKQRIPLRSGVNIWTCHPKHVTPAIRRISDPCRCALFLQCVKLPLGALFVVMSTRELHVLPLLIRHPCRNPSLLCNDYMKREELLQEYKRSLSAVNVRFRPASQRFHNRGSESQSFPLAVGSWYFGEPSAGLSLADRPSAGGRASPDPLC